MSLCSAVLNTLGVLSIPKTGLVARYLSTSCTCEKLMCAPIHFTEPECMKWYRVHLYCLQSYFILSLTCHSYLRTAQET